MLQQMGVNMLFRIIKAYWKSRKSYDVIIINAHWKDIIVINTDDIHVEISLISTKTSKLLEKYGYIGTARTHERRDADDF